MRASWTLALAIFLGCFPAAGFGAQETQTDPQPVMPAPQTTEQPPQQQQQGTQKPAPIERRASKPTANSAEEVDGPLTTPQGGTGTAQPAGRTRTGQAPVGTFHVKSRLVNVALNVVDAHDVPVGGFEKKDFQIYENGKPQTTAVFEREATSPLEIVLAIDSSETVLTSDRLEKEAAKHFVRAILRPQDGIELIDFADTVREIVPFTNQSKRIEEGLNELKQGDETALYNAIYLASDVLAKTPQTQNRRRVLVVISDGGNSIQGGEKFEQAVEEAQRADAIIYSIIIVPVEADAGRNTGGEHTLIQMSEDTGGKYYYVVDPKDLEPAFEHISDDLRTQYLLGYYAPDTQDDTSFRRIKVTLTDADAAAKYQLRYRTGYFPDSQ